MGERKRRQRAELRETGIAALAGWALPDRGGAGCLGFPAGNPLSFQSLRSLNELPGLRPSGTSFRPLRQWTAQMTPALLRPLSGPAALTRPSLADRLSRPGGRSVLAHQAFTDCGSQRGRTLRSRPCGLGLAPGVGECGLRSQVRPSVERRPYGLGRRSGRCALLNRSFFRPRPYA